MSARAQQAIPVVQATGLAFIAAVSSGLAPDTSREDRRRMAYKLLDAVLIYVEEKEDGHE